MSAKFILDKSESQWIQIVLDDNFKFVTTIPSIRLMPSIRDGVLRSGMLLYLHHINFKIFFHPAKLDNIKDEKISEFKTVSVSQRKNLLG